MLHVSTPGVARSVPRPEVLAPTLDMTMASLAQDLAQERKERLNEHAMLWKDIKILQSTTAQIIENIVGGTLNPAIEKLQGDVANHQQQQELHGKVMRDDFEDLKGQVHQQFNNLEVVIRQVRADFEEQVSGNKTDADKAGMEASMGAECSDDKAFSFQAELAQELANVLFHSEQQSVEFVKAVEQERSTRMQDAAELYALVQGSLEHMEQHSDVKIEHGVAEMQAAYRDAVSELVGVSAEENKQHWSHVESRFTSQLKDLACCHETNSNSQTSRDQSDDIKRLREELSNLSRLVQATEEKETKQQLEISQARCNATTASHELCSQSANTIVTAPGSSCVSLHPKSQEQAMKASSVVEPSPRTEHMAGIGKSSAVGTAHNASPAKAMPTNTQDITSPAGGRVSAVAVAQRRSIHSVPAALHGLTDAPFPLQAGARRKALVVGCSYFSSPTPLRGTLNDAWNVLSLVRHTLRYGEDQVRVLTDGSASCKTKPCSSPTRQNILDGLDWLVADAQAGDDLLFYFGGYGTQQPAGTEDDELCEAFLVPIDYQQTSIVDTARCCSSGGYSLVPLLDILHAVAALPAGCKITLVLDCCHGIVPGIGSPGSVQPNTFSRVHAKSAVPTEADTPPPFQPSVRWLDLPRVRSSSNSPTKDKGRLNWGLPTEPTKPSPAPDMQCQVYCFSACQHEQWSAEIPIEGVMQGAFTWAWIKALMAGHLDPPIRQLTVALRAILADLRRHFQWIDQTPVVQMSSAAKQAEVRREEPGIKRPVSAPPPPLPSNVASRKALLIGINYSDAHAQLKGCVNDAWNMNCLLRHSLKFQEDQVRLLIDGENGMPPKEARRPTYANIIAGLQWLVQGAQPGDCLFLLFSGFGTQHPQSPSSDMQEACIVPCDFAVDVPPELLTTLSEDMGAQALRPRSQQAESKGYRLLPLVELNQLASQLPAGSKLTIILDCSYPVVPNLGPANNLAPTFPKVSRGRVDYSKLHDFVSRPRFLELPPLLVQNAPTQLQHSTASPECVLHCFVACKVEEWDAELPLEGTVQGIFTWAFTKALAAGRFRSTAGELQEALLQRTAELRQHFKGVRQTPVLLLSKAASVDDTVV